MTTYDIEVDRKRVSGFSLTNAQQYRTLGDLRDESERNGMSAPVRRHPLRVEREQRNWSQARVAETIGISTRTIMRWEQGAVLPQPFYRERLCELFGKNASELGIGIQPLPESSISSKGRALIQSVASLTSAASDNPAIMLSQDQIPPSSPDNEPLLSTKFFVPVPTHALVRRTRLTDLLTAGTKSTLTLLSAPAGSGKTTLIAEWLEFFLPSVLPAWVSLDDEDNNPTLFWLYVLTALDACRPGLYTSLINALRAQQVSSWPTFLKQVLNALLESSQPLFLVLDDYHLITEQAVHSSMTYFLEHLPAHIHLIVSTRSDPQWPLARLRARGQLLEIRLDQLCGTVEEVDIFFSQAIQVKLTAPMLAEVTARTEGWMAGIQLLAISLHGRTDVAALLDSLHGGQRDIFDYLMEEVIARQSPTIQDFLLRTSILTRLNASCCDAVIDTQGSQEILEFLERANLFIIPLDQQRHWYRYHHLFAQALRSRLTRTYESDLIRTLHRRAGHWLSQHGSPREMIPHALSAQEWMMALDAMKLDTIEHTSFHHVWGRQHTILQKWIEQLPADILRQQPLLCLRYAILLTWHPHTTASEHWLNEAEKTLIAQGVEPLGALASAVEPQQKLLGEIISLRALTTVIRGEGQKALPLCQEAERYFGDHDFSQRAKNLFCFTLAYYLCDQSVLAIPRLQEALQLAEEARDYEVRDMVGGHIMLQLSLLGRLKQAWGLGKELFASQESLLFATLSWPDIYQADILREWNNLDTAIDLAEQAVQQAEKLEKHITLPKWYAVLAHCLFSKGDLDAMEHILQKAKSLIDRLHDPLRHGSYITVLRVRLWIACGNLEEANRWAHRYRTQEDEPSLIARALKDIVFIRVLIANEEYDQAQQRLNQALQQARTAQRDPHIIELLILQALVYQSLHEKQAAYTSLSQALTLAQAEGYVRIFVDEGMLIAELLIKLQQQQPELASYIDILLSSFQGDPLPPTR
jgi:LuxR family transcriptional regulator, maltose regulon positive regulatory protein